MSDIQNTRSQGIESSCRFRGSGRNILSFLPAFFSCTGERFVLPDIGLFDDFISLRASV